MPLDEILVLRSDTIELLFATDNTSDVLFPGFRNVSETFFFYWHYNPLWVCILQPSSRL
jgi:hypothetical protein